MTELTHLNLIIPPLQYPLYKIPTIKIETSYEDTIATNPASLTLPPLAPSFFVVSSCCPAVRGRYTQGLCLEFTREYTCAHRPRALT